jgi:hypothetical protein
MLQVDGKIRAGTCIVTDDDVTYRLAGDPRLSVDCHPNAVTPAPLDRSGVWPALEVLTWNTVHDASSVTTGPPTGRR